MDKLRPLDFLSNWFLFFFLLLTFASHTSPGITFNPAQAALLLEKGYAVPCSCSLGMKWDWNEPFTYDEPGFKNLKFYIK